MFCLELDTQVQFSPSSIASLWTESRVNEVCVKCHLRSYDNTVVGLGFGLSNVLEAGNRRSCDSSI